MKRNLRITLSVILAVLLTVCCATIAVFAATADETQAANGKTCRIGAEGIGTYYASVSAAIDAAQNGDVITVIKNDTAGLSKTVSKTITLRSDNASEISGVAINVGANQKSSADPGHLTLAGNLKLKSTGAMLLVKNGSLNVEDDVYAETTGNYIIDNYGDGTNKIVINIKGGTLVGNGSATDKGVVGLFTSNGSELNISGGKIIQKKVGSWALKIPTDKNKTINITGGELVANWGTVALYADDKDTSGTFTTVNISGGTIKAEADSALMFCGYGRNAEVNISGTAKLTAPVKTLYVWSKNAAGTAERISRNITLNINGGLVESTKNADTSNAVHVRNAKNITLNISGGTVRAAGARAVYVESTENFKSNVSGGLVSANKWTYQIYGSVTGAVNVSGGTVEAINGNKTIYLTQSANKQVDLTVTGGTVSATIPATYETYDANTMDGQQAIFVMNANSSKVTLSGGTVKALQETIRLDAAGNSLTVSDNASVEVDYDFAIRNKGSNVTVTGGTLTSGGYTVYLVGGASVTNTVSVNGGKLISGGNSVIAISSAGTMNVTGGTFVQRGTGSSAKIIADVAGGSAFTATVNGGLFVNENTANTVLFDKTVTFNSGRILYGANITAFKAGGEATPKSVQATYGTDGNVYYFYSRYAATDAEKSGVMEEGASVRLTPNTTGMRFTTVFDEIEGATYGTVILPARYLVNLNFFTMEALDASDVEYLNVVAENGMDVADGKVTVRAAITNIYKSNYDTAFAAIAYVKVGDTYYYSEFDLGDNVRTVDFVSRAALDDLTATADDEYKYAVEAYGTTLYSPYAPAQRAVLEGFVAVTVDVPRAENAVLINSGNGCYQYYSANVDASAYDTYKASLVSAGFAKVAEKVIDGNTYTTFTKGNQIVTLTYTPNTKEMKVLMESTDNTALPTKEDYKAPATTVPTTVTQLGQWYVDTATESHKYYPESGIGNIIGFTRDFATAYNSGMGYIIRLEDGSFIIVDGGYNTTTHADNLYNVLKKQAGDSEIVIAAWIFTHAHDDHVGTFRAFTKAYASKVTVERFIYNFPASESAIFGGQSAPDVTTLLGAMSNYANAVRTVAHPGQVFNIRNAAVTILYTYEMLQPQNLTYYNACSMVFNVAVENSTILFLGDAGGDTDATQAELSALMSIYGAALKADVVQAAHHGLDSETEKNTQKQFYAKIDADHVFVPCASLYTKVDGKFIVLESRGVYKSNSGATMHLAGATVTVMTLNDGKISVTSADNVATYTEENA